MKCKRINWTVLSLILLFLLALAGPVYGGNHPDNTEVAAEEAWETNMRGRVLAVEDRPGSDSFFRSQWVTLEIYAGELKGEVITVENHLSDHPVYDIVVQPGDRVLLVQEIGQTGETESIWLIM